jgi:hypothetical protein
MTTYLFPAQGNKHAFSLEDFSAALKTAYTEYEKYQQGIKDRSQVSQDKVNNLVSYWMEKLPAFFLGALIEGHEIVQFGVYSYPKYGEYTKEFLAAIFKQAYPHFKLLLSNLGVEVYAAKVEEDEEIPFFQIRVEDLKRLVA